MADFNKTLELILAKQGAQPFSRTEAEEGDLLICSDCFRDQGLSLNAYRIGIENTDKCPKCGSESGHKLTRKLAHNLCYAFFVRGSIHRFAYGGFPLIQFNNQRYNNSDIEISSWLTEDVKLIEETAQVGLFYYNPRHWMFGENEVLKSLLKKRERKNAIDKILQTYPSFDLTQDHYFYRVRVNPNVPYEVQEYDSAPKKFCGKNRFDYRRSPTLYGSPDIELCIHECRISAEDDLYTATLVPTRNLKVLNLAPVEEKGVTEFESMNMAIYLLFLAGKHSYEICREIAKGARELGFDGIIYPSYFTHLRTGSIPFETVKGLSITRSEMREYIESQYVPNLAIFGNPIKDGKIKVRSINRVVIDRVGYELTFGPAKTGPKDLRTILMRQANELGKL